MSQDPFGTPPAARMSSAVTPWGLLGSIAWGTAGLVAWFAVQIAVIAIYAQTRGLETPAELAALRHDGFLLAVTVVIGGPAWIGVSALAARLRGWRARDYLALVVPSRKEILFGVACLAPLLIAFDLLTLAFGRDVVPAFMQENYLTARAAGALPVFFLAVVVVAPLTEEIAFRGFLFRGLSETWFGTAGTIVATSAAWAAMHVQYDWAILAQIFLIGLLLGWLRWASGSTLLTITLHVLANLTASIQAAIKVEWLG
jgi:membrane protease YdiL (CAAX protease family)